MGHSADRYDMVVHLDYGMIVILRPHQRFRNQR